MDSEREKLIRRVWSEQGSGAGNPPFMASAVRRDPGISIDCHRRPLLKVTCALKYYRGIKLSNFMQNL
jgi:hypothetical protein